MSEEILELSDLLKDPELLARALKSMEVTGNLPVLIQLEFHEGSEAKSMIHINVYELLRPYLEKIHELNEELKCRDR